MRVNRLAILGAIAPIALFSTHAHADCASDLRGAFANIDQQAMSDANMSGRDVRRLRQAAVILANAGYEDACMELVEVAQDLPEGNMREDGNRQTNRQNAQNRNRNRGNDRQNAQNRNGDGNGEETQLSESERRRVRMARNATPVMEQDGEFSINSLIGTTLYSSTSGKSVGEVEDLVFGGNQPAAILGHGGFLGMGEKRIKLALNEVMVGQNGETHFVAMSDREIQNQPGLEKRNGRWVTTAAEADNNRQRRSDRRNASDDRNRNASNDRSDVAQTAERMVNSAKRAVTGQDDAPRTTGSIEQAGENRQRMSANTVIGKNVYSSQSNEKIGEIEDVVFSIDSSQAPAIILGHGGFLGMGEKRVMITMSDLQRRQRDGRYFVGLSDQKIKQMAGLEKTNGRWQSQPAEADNDERADNNRSNN